MLDHDQTESMITIDRNSQYPKQVIHILVSELEMHEAKLAQEGLAAIAVTRTRALGLGHG
jgi:hypothetical protein